jgi:tetratricopeptide (TPR) repeat protein
METNAFVEKRRLAHEISSKARELELEERKVVVQEGQLKALTFRFFRWTTSTTVLTVILAFVSLLGFSIKSLYLANQTWALEEKRLTGQEKLNADKFESDLILSAIRTGTPESARKNLEFLLQSGLLSEHSVRIQASLAKGSTPVLPLSGGRTLDSNILLDLAISKEQQGDFLLAKEFYQKAVIGFQVANDVAGVANAFLRLGNLSLKVGEVKSALAYAEQAQLMFLKSEDSYGQSMVHELLGRIYNALHKPADAEIHFNKALELNSNLQAKSPPKR